MGVAKKMPWLVLGLIACARAACGLGWVRASSACSLLREFIAVSICFDRGLLGRNKEKSLVISGFF